MLDRCWLNSDFHGAGGNTEPVGAVADIVCRRRVRRGTVLEAMIAAMNMPLLCCKLKFWRTRRLHAVVLAT